MNDIPDFAEALQRFRQFLTDSGHRSDVFWIFPEDIWRISPTRSVVRYPPPSENVTLAQRVFAEGRERGLVEMTAVATTGDKVAVTVWFPKFPREEVQGWGRGMKLTMLEPLRSARVLSPWKWQLLRFVPRYRRSLTAERFIGTRDWARQISPGERRECGCQLEIQSGDKTPRSPNR
jgi:hypothetical protein